MMLFQHPKSKDWHLWFAWRPVVASGHWVWLEWVERRWFGQPYQKFWSYATPGTAEREREEIGRHLKQWADFCIRSAEAKAAAPGPAGGAKESKGGA